MVGIKFQNSKDISNVGKAYAQIYGFSIAGDPVVRSEQGHVTIVLNKIFASSPDGTVELKITLNDRAEAVSFNRKYIEK